MSMYEKPFPFALTPDKTPEPSAHALRVLVLYGSLRTRSYSRLLAEESARVLVSLGAEVRIFDP